MSNVSFGEIWGKCLIRMRDDGLFALYTASQDCKSGEIERNSMVIYSPDYNIEFLNKNLKIIEDLIYEETLLELELEVRSESEQDKDETKQAKIKKYFGKFLVIKN